MPNKTRDIEIGIVAALANGPLTLDGLEAGGRFAWLDDRRWLGVAIGNMRRDGRLVWVECDPDHSHDGNCAISWSGGVG
jgi:hypothetical protein